MGSPSNRWVAGWSSPIRLSGWGEDFSPDSSFAVSVGGTLAAALGAISAGAGASAAGGTGGLRGGLGGCGAATSASGGGAP